MRVIVEPKNFEQEQWNYLAVGYYNGKVIAKNEIAELYYMECEEAVAPIGTVVTEDAVTPIVELDEEEQKEIRRIYGNKRD